MAEEPWNWPWYVTLAAVAFILVVPLRLGPTLARRWRMPDYAGKFSFVLFTLFAGVVISYYGWSTNHIQLGIDLKGGSYLVYQLLEGEAGKLEQDTTQPGGTSRRSAASALGQVDMDKLVAALRRRVDPSGVLGVKIRAYGAKQIEIKVPQVDQKQVDRLKKMIAEVGSLEFRILATDRKAVPFKSYIQRAKALPDDQTELWDEKKGDEPAKLLAWWVPVAEKKEGEFRNIHFGRREITDRKGRKRLEILIVNDPWSVTGEKLTRATPGVDRVGKPCVNFMFNSVGAALFGHLTGYYSPDKVQGIKYNLGIILDRKLVTAPSIRGVIFDRGEISGGFDQERVNELVDVLNAGALPAALSPRPISERTTGPELGQDTIQAGKLSMVVALTFVFLSVLIYYRFAGIVACIALAMNACLLLACMIIINAEFSLAGIAGFALSIGMAVDANVLIYERMREEAGRGAALRMTIRNGFERALSAIIDSNLTTLITAVILYAVGSDQVRGFAVTLFLGIVLSMYTAIIVARVIFDVAERRRWIDRVKMMRALPPTHFDFLHYKWVMIGISLAIIAIGLVATFARGRGILDIDFTGGVSVETVFRTQPDIREVRKALEERPEEERLPDVTVREITSGRMGEQGLGKTFIIDASNPSGENAEQYRDIVKKILEGIFGQDLARNHMAYTTPIPLAAAVRRDAPAMASAPLSAEPEGGGGFGGLSQSSRSENGTLPLGARPELVTLSAALLGQGPPAKPEAAAQKAKVAADAAKVTTEGAKKDAGGAAPPAEKPPASPPGKSPAAAAAPSPGEAKKPPALTPAEKPLAVDPFAGGTKTTLTFDQAIDHATLEAHFTRAIQAQEGDKWKAVEFVIENKNYEEGSLGRFLTWDVKIKLPPPRAESVFKAIAADLQSTPFFPSSESIGGEVAKQTRTRAIFALAASAFFILLYLWVRFQRVAYGLGAVVSLVHDVLVTLACVSVSLYLAPALGVLLVEPFKINVIMMTAFLTIAGYSLNDTIVIFDRIREVRGKAPQVTQEMINTSINQTLGRTLLTGLTSMMVIVTLYILGGPTIHGFAFAMIIGVITGTYSSIYIASPFLLWISRKAEKRRSAG